MILNPHNTPYSLTSWASCVVFGSISKTNDCAITLFVTVIKSRHANHALLRSQITPNIGLTAS